jgi:hypothetical protein
MADLLLMVLVAVSFALALGYADLCGRVTGKDEGS